MDDGGSVLPPGSTNRASHSRPRPRSVSSGGSGQRRGSRGGADDDSVCVSNEGNNDSGGGLSFRSIISSASFASLPRAGERNAPAYHKDKVEQPTVELNSVNGTAISGGKGCGFIRDLYNLKQVYNDSWSNNPVLDMRERQFVWEGLVPSVNSQNRFSLY